MDCRDKIWQVFGVTGQIYPWSATCLKYLMESIRAEKGTDELLVEFTVTHSIS
jgi:hypothetical protein